MAQTGEGLQNGDEAHTHKNKLLPIKGEKPNWEEKVAGLCRSCNFLVILTFVILKEEGNCQYTVHKQKLM